MIHLADYVTSRYKWYNFYTGYSKKKILGKQRSALASVNFATIITLGILTIVFKDYYLETIGYLGDIIIQRVTIGIAILLVVWSVNGVISIKASKYNTELIEEWWHLNKDNQKEFSSLDIAILKNRGYL